MKSNHFRDEILKLNQKKRKNCQVVFKNFLITSSFLIFHKNNKLQNSLININCL